MPACRLLVLCLLAALAPAAFAQTPPAAVPPGTDTCAEATSEAYRLLRRTLHQRGSPDLRDDMVFPRLAGRDESIGVSGTSVRILVRLDPAEGDWSGIRLAAAARTRETVRPFPPDASAAQRNDPCYYGFAPVFARIRSVSGTQASIEVNYPNRRGFGLLEPWILVVELTKEKDDRVIGYATFDAEIGSSAWGVTVALLLVSLSYLALVLVSARINERRLDRAQQQLFGRDEPATGWRLRRAADPLFVVQDASGISSLARLQLLAFTLVVAGLSAYILTRTGTMAALSPDVLKLLGITVAGSSLSRIAGETGSVSAPNRIWLKGKGLIVADDARLPKFSDLVCADGELEIARVQALVFSGLTLAALLIAGPRDLGTFAISDEMLYLLGLSQLTYVAGKAIPAEGVRRLNQEVAALRAAERQLLAARSRQAELAALVPPLPAPPAEAAAQAAAEAARVAQDLAAAHAAWDAALTAAEDTLLDVYGEMLDTSRLRALRSAPG